MNKYLSMALAAMLGSTMIVLSMTEADARHRRHLGAGIAGGVIGGLIIGGAIANSNRRARERRYRPRQERRYRGGAHERWCYRKYRSYRAYDNTFQPYRGGRRYCRSPYG